MNNLKIVVTGATRGIGLSITQAFAKQGADLAVCARDEVELKKLKGQIK